MRGAPQLIKRSAAAQDPQLAARLWSLSEQLTGVRSPLRDGGGSPAPTAPRRSA
jgi:hypothetical protein